MIVSLTAKHGKTDLQVSIICLGAMRFGARDSKDLSFQMLMLISISALTATPA
jgi:aryl-alcohol dehydrogenase-like predicted oxidoreductase